MKFLIDNCVPLNNGDAALVFGVGESLSKYGEVAYHTYYFKQVKKLYPDKKWHRHLLDYPIMKLLKRIPLLSRSLILFLIVIRKSVYKSVDTVISAPGGYINSYYAIGDKMFILYICKRWLKKRVGIYSQSIGPLTVKDQRLLIKYGQRLDFIYVRDQLSYDRLMSMHPFDNVVLTKDAAFLLTPNLLKKTSKKQVVVSVRSWHFDQRKEETYFNNLQLIVNQLLARGYQVCFLSTCQGMKEYVDDSEVAQKFIETYYQGNLNISVDANFYSLDSLRNRLTEFDFAIATRLHMCILALLSGVPAFNISYEEKGKACYDYLGLEEFSIDYNEEKDFSHNLTQFLTLTETKKNQIFAKVARIHEDQEEFLGKVGQEGE
ncbi:polysaccharide pyruvyl transferase family protein [uncultured Vagococcus sp.]|uniref:polysaccharide pyruvyl transferase family protein n=1 Tax=uncultured Vagococcus sp. TaxID=189676 RepID=UPI0028D8333F|nr:polysaccharide pyruvyl transferase family protein [uncultured Vagococcus sp.]